MAAVQQYVFQHQFAECFRQAWQESNNGADMSAGTETDGAIEKK